MKKRIFILTILIFGIIFIGGCSTKPSTDALKFKKDYESINGTLNSSNLEYRTIEIDEDNPLVFTTAENIVKMIEDKKTFYLYVGDKQCPWCRSVIEKFIEVAKENNIEEVYYLNIWDDEHNEILRDVYSLNEDGEASRTHEGTMEYYKLLEYFDAVLTEYTLKNGDDTIDTLEKRIYAPNFFYVLDGEAVKMVEGISGLQEGSRDELTEAILDEEESIFREFFNN